MTTAQRHDRARRDRAAMVATLRAEFGTGTASLRMRDVARTLGVPVTTVYRYFDSIDDVRRAIDPQPVPVVRRPPTGPTFTDAFVERAAGPEQIAQVVRGLLGDRLAIGPLAVGPKSAKAVATAEGVFGAISVDRGRRPATMIVSVPVSLDIEVRIGRNYRRRFTAQVLLPVTVAIAPNPDLRLTVDIQRPDRADIAVAVDVYGLSLKLMRRIGRVDELLRTHSLEHLDTILSSPAGRAATTIDLGRVIDDAWERGLVLP